MATTPTGPTPEQELMKMMAEFNEGMKSLSDTTRGSMQEKKQQIVRFIAAHPSDLKPETRQRAMARINGAAVNKALNQERQSYFAGDNGSYVTASGRVYSREEVLRINDYLKANKEQAEMVNGSVADVKKRTAGMGLPLPLEAAEEQRKNINSVLGEGGTGRRRGWALTGGLATVAIVAAVLGTVSLGAITGGLGIVPGAIAMGAGAAWGTLGVSGIAAIAAGISGGICGLKEVIRSRDPKIMEARHNRIIANNSEKLQAAYNILERRNEFDQKQIKKAEKTAQKSLRAIEKENSRFGIKVDKRIASISGIDKESLFKQDQFKYLKNKNNEQALKNVAMGFKFAEVGLQNAVSPEMRAMMEGEAQKGLLGRTKESILGKEHTNVADIFNKNQMYEKVVMDTLTSPDMNKMADYKGLSLDEAMAKLQTDMGVDIKNLDELSQTKLKMKIMDAAPEGSELKGSIIENLTEKSGSVVNLVEQMAQGKIPYDQTVANYYKSNKDLFVEKFEGKAPKAVKEPAVDRIKAYEGLCAIMGEPTISDEEKKSAMDKWFKDQKAAGEKVSAKEFKSIVPGGYSIETSALLIFDKIDKIMSEPRLSDAKKDAYLKDVLEHDRLLYRGGWDVGNLKEFYNDNKDSIQEEREAYKDYTDKKQEYDNNVQDAKEQDENFEETCAQLDDRNPDKNQRELQEEQVREALEYGEAMGQTK